MKTSSYPAEEYANSFSAGLSPLIFRKIKKK